MEDDAVFCPNCGAHAEPEQPVQAPVNTAVNSNPAPVQPQVFNPGSQSPAPVVFGANAVNQQKPKGDGSIGIDLVLAVFSILAAITGTVFILANVTPVFVGLIILGVAMVVGLVAMILGLKSKSKLKALDIVSFALGTVALLAFAVLTVVLAVSNNTSPILSLYDMRYGVTAMADSPAEESTTAPATTAPATTAPATTVPPQTQPPTQPAPATTMPVYVPQTQPSVVAYAGTELIVNTRKSNLMLRSGKSTSSPKIAEMPKGSHVYVYTDYYGDGWVQVVYNGQVGWASAQYLAIYRY